MFGRTRTHRTLTGERQQKLPQGEWHTLLRDAHPAYLSWEQYQENERRLQENAHALGPDRRKSPPREGPALLQGLAICGICGERMKVVYHVRAGVRVPDYLCDGRTVDDPQPVCQWISGAQIDGAVGQLLLEIMTPVAIEVSLAVQQELQTRLEEVDRLRKQQVERARYEADLAQHQIQRNLILGTRTERPQPHCQRSTWNRSSITGSINRGLLAGVPPSLRLQNERPVFSYWPAPARLLRFRLW